MPTSVHYEDINLQKTFAHVNRKLTKMSSSIEKSPERVHLNLPQITPPKERKPQLQVQIPQIATLSMLLNEDNDPEYEKLLLQNTHYKKKSKSPERDLQFRDSIQVVPKTFEDYHQSD